MGLTELLEGKIVFFDTAPIIYVFENKEPYKSILVPFFLAFDDGRIRAITSTTTLAEVLTQPYRFEQMDLVRTYWDVFDRIDTWSLTIDIAGKTASVRAKYGFKTPDAVQWAIFVSCEADYFLTNDRGFKKLDDKRVLLPKDFV